MEACLAGDPFSALARADPAVALEVLLAVCIEESDHVLTMLRSLMDISEAEAGIMKLDRTRVSLDRLAGEVAELYEHVADEVGITFTITRDERAIVFADATRLRQAIANLVDNALKYTPRGGAVKLEVEHTATEALVRVRDTGEGITPVLSDKDAAAPALEEALAAGQLPKYEDCAAYVEKLRGAR